MPVFHFRPVGPGLLWSHQWDSREIWRVSKLLFATVFQIELVLLECVLGYFVVRVYLLSMKYLSPWFQVFIVLKLSLHKSFNFGALIQELLHNLELLAILDVLHRQVELTHVVENTGSVRYSSQMLLKFSDIINLSLLKLKTPVPLFLLLFDFVEK